ncbi:MAG: M50 family metallopeptidase [Planctomycetaceae bacterium]
MRDAGSNRRKRNIEAICQLDQIVLMASLLPLCWLVMLATHELGHVLGAWLTGARVSYVELHPLRISRTDVVANRLPLLVAWAGPLVGCTLPLGVWGLSWGRRWRAEFAVRFLTGFCLVGNGAYLGAGTWGRVGDAGVLLDAGCPVWFMWLFGAVAVSGGIRMWHGLGTRFGWGNSSPPVDRRVAWSVLLILLAVALVEFIYWN